MSKKQIEPETRLPNLMADEEPALDSDYCERTRETLACCESDGGLRLTLLSNKNDEPLGQTDAWFTVFDGNTGKPITLYICHDDMRGLADFFRRCVRSMADVTPEPEGVK